MIRRIGLVLLGVLAPAALAEQRIDGASHAFNWLASEPSCRRLSSAERASLRRCTASRNAFGLDAPALACRVDGRTEYMIYPSAAMCREALETMRANGP